MLQRLLRNGILLAQGLYLLQPLHLWLTISLQNYLSEENFVSCNRVNPYVLCCHFALIRTFSTLFAEFCFFNLWNNVNLVRHAKFHYQSI